MAHSKFTTHSLTAPPPRCWQVFVRRSGPLAGTAVEAFSLMAVMTSFVGCTLSLSETLRSEAPPLLRELSRRVLRWAGTSADVSADSCDGGDDYDGVDELACLMGSSSCTSSSSSSSSAVAEAAALLEGGSPSAGGGGAFGGADQHRGLALALTLLPPLALAATNPDGFLDILQFASSYGMVALYGLLPPAMAWSLWARQQQQQQQQQQQRGQLAPPLQQLLPSQLQGEGGAPQLEAPLVPGGPFLPDTPPHSRTVDDVPGWKGLVVEEHAGRVTWRAGLVKNQAAKGRATGEPAAITGSVSLQLCRDNACTPPETDSP